MNHVPTLAEIRQALKSIPMAHPAITPEAAELLGPAARVIEEIGIPQKFGDWFWAVDPIDVEAVVKRFDYKFGNERRSCGESARICCGHFGSLVFAPATGHIVHVEPEGHIFLANTSIESFLYFTGRVSGATSCDASDILRDCKRFDPVPFIEENAGWSVVIEEIEEGFYD